MSPALEPLRQTKTILLTTYKRDGTPVDTPVSIAFDADRAYFRTWHKAHKTKRLRNNPNVAAAPSHTQGGSKDAKRMSPRGRWPDGTASCRPSWCR